jgi:hypothetical protein
MIRLGMLRRSTIRPSASVGCLRPRPGGAGDAAFDATGARLRVPFRPERVKAAVAAART